MENDTEEWILNQIFSNLYLHGAFLCFFCGQTLLRVYFKNVKTDPHQLNTSEIIYCMCVLGEQCDGIVSRSAPRKWLSTSKASLMTHLPILLFLNPLCTINLSLQHAIPPPPPLPFSIHLLSSPCLVWGDCIGVGVQKWLRVFFTWWFQSDIPMGIFHFLWDNHSQNRWFSLPIVPQVMMTFTPGI